ncbi:MAG: CRISPR-associated endonuclease Cas2 [Clostridiales bacterium]|jgi:CRISPR-associated protein Cas2|nr:CRISPR-associated endonuclease Cas2 [Clostridiales bacterium]
MMILITYDVDTTDKEGRTRLRKVAKECVNYGQRVQNSVFECNLTYLDFVKLKTKLEKLINPKKDSLRYYNLGKNWRRKVEHHGAKPSYDPEGVIIV